MRWLEHKKHVREGKRKELLVSEHSCDEDTHLPEPAPQSALPSTGILDPLSDLGMGDTIDPNLFCSEPIIDSFPDNTAGAPISEDMYEPPDLGTYLRSCGCLAKLRNFEDAELLMTTGLNNKGRDQHLCSRRYRGQTPWRTNRELLKDIDKLPHGPEWVAQDIEIGEGDNTRYVTMFKRDVVEVVRELMGNPRFKECMRYTPEQHWTSDTRTHRVYSELWTGNWWWRMQRMLNKRHATIAPIILASDKTVLSTIGGDQQAYPVYLTLGNISKKIRRKPTERATILLGYLPVTSFDEERNSNKQERMKGELLHRAMEGLLEPLKVASRDGVEMCCADGRQRRVFPILAAYIGDWPEQSDMACTMRSRCPVCTVKFQSRGSYQPNTPFRTRQTTLAALREYQADDDLVELKRSGLKPWHPFWANLPHVRFSRCITPDLLHQLHIGIFKAHLVKWASRIIGKPTIDRRFSAMSRMAGMRHFKSGIHNVKRWTGRESKEMAKQMLPVVVGRLHATLVTLARNILDFVYRAHAAQMTDPEVDELTEALKTVHQLKPHLVEFRAEKEIKHFNRIPKLRMMSHYAHSIRELGTPDRYNAEAPEHLHIEYAKDPWRASSKRDAIPQMIRYIQRQEAIRIHQSKLNAYQEMVNAGLEKDFRTKNKCDDGCDDGDGGWEDVNDETLERADPNGMEAPKLGVSTAYPDPRSNTIAYKPTLSKVSGSDLANNYGTVDLLPSTSRHLASIGVDAATAPLSPNHLFDVWHRFYINHDRFPFAPEEEPTCDVVRATPPTYNRWRRISRPGVFDMVLFLHRRDAFGIHRYRAGRVRAIFRLPKPFRTSCPQPLAYLELFNPFPSTPDDTHRMYTTFPSYTPEGQRQTIVIPISDIVLACHIAPRFPRNDSELPVQLNSRIDILSVRMTFFFNHYASYYIYKLVEHWRKVRAERERTEKERLERERLERARERGMEDWRVPARGRRRGMGKRL